MNIKDKSLLYNLLQDIDKNKISKFKTYISGDKLALQLVEAFEANKNNVSDELIFQSISKVSSEIEFQKLKKNTADSLLNFIHLTQFSENSNERLKKDLELAYILCDYGYKEIGLSRIRKIKKIAQSYNHFDVVAIALDYILKYDYSYRLKPEKAVKICNEIDENLALIANQNAYTHLSLQIFSYQNIFSVEEDTVNQFLNNPLLKDSRKPKSIIARYYYYMALMDSYSLIKNYEERFIVVKNAVAYFKGILKTNEYFFSKYIFLLERKAHSALLLRDFKELKKIIIILEQIKVPSIYANNHSFLYDIEFIRLKYSNIYLINNSDQEKAFNFLKNEYSTILSNKHASIGDLQQAYYTIIFHYAVKFQKHQEIINLAPQLSAFFHQNYKSLDSNRTNLIQIFICFFLSAYKVFNKTTYIEFINSKLKYKNEKIFNKIDGNFYYVDKLNEVILDAYDKDFFDEVVYKKYLSIWEEKPRTLDKAICISQNTLPDEYLKAKNQAWNKKYKNRCF